MQISNAADSKACSDPHSRRQTFRRNSSMEYLGTVLHADGSQDHEINRRIGCAKADFIALSKLWRHSACTWPKKLRIFSATIEAKLLYSLSSVCLTVAQQRKLDGFQNRCIRSIVGIKPAFLSRVSNAAVLEKAGHTAATQLLKNASCSCSAKF